ncbi:hypothetical protein L218DRAFT_862644 [Marasmius fiardii PR-910]|nr:hypothetical protein L218DRAFT_862644 [Marasmius fiardii PR-910]
MAWAPIGGRARKRDFFVRGTKYSILPAISLDGVLHLDVIEQSYTAETFNAFIEILLTRMNPFPEKNSVIVMDNAVIHKDQELRPMIEACYIRSNRDYARMELMPHADVDPYALFWNAVYESMTPENIHGWYRDSGYL